jgi:type IV pilus assembly protein PilM
LCLDWDKRHVRLVLVRLQRRGPVLQAAHSTVIPAEVNPDEPGQMGEFIAQQLRRHKLTARQVLVDVPRDRAVLNRLTLPPTPDPEVAELVRFQAMKELPFPLEEAEIDFAPLRRDERKRVTEVLLAAVLRRTLQRIQATCAAAGLKPARIGLRPYANMMAVQQVQGVSPDKLLFVDVGTSLTEIDIFQDQRLAFSRAASVELPGAHAHGHATDSRILTTAELDSTADRAAHALDDLLVEIARSLQAYRATDPAAKVETIIIAGGTGLEPALRDRAAERFGLDCRLFDPAVQLKLDKPDGEKLRGFSAALGLGWGLDRAGSFEIDFLNPKRPIARRTIQLQRARIIGLGVATAAVVVGGFMFHKWQGNTRQIAALEERAKKLRAEVRTALTLRHAADRVKEWETSAVWPEELLRLTEAAVEPGRKMVVQQIRGDHRNARLEVRQLQADDFEIPTQFVSNLHSQLVASQPIYRAVAGTWAERAASDKRKFKGSLDIQVTLRKLEELMKTAADREKARKAELRKYPA